MHLLNTYMHFILLVDFSDILASIAPVAGSPMIGYGDLPSVPISLIDFHGYNDDVIPYDLDHSEGNKSLYIALH